jgi:hypothetical protein
VHGVAIDARHRSRDDRHWDIPVFRVRGRERRLSPKPVIAGPSPEGKHRQAIEHAIREMLPQEEQGPSGQAAAVSAAEPAARQIEHVVDQGRGAADSTAGTKAGSAWRRIARRHS